MRRGRPSALRLGAAVVVVSVLVVVCACVSAVSAATATAVPVVRDSVCAPVIQSTAELVIGVLLTVGVFGSYVPQWVSFARRRSADGISNFMMFVGASSSFTGFITGLVLQYETLICCPKWTPGTCATNLLGLFQLGGLLLGYTPNYFLFMVFNPYRNKPDERRAYLISLWLFGAYFAIVAVVGSLAVGLLGSFAFNSYAVLGYGDALGIVTVVCTLIQWLPQLITTGRKGSVGALSVPMLMIQVPGSVLWIVYQAYILRESLMTWVPYCFTVLQQVILLSMCAVFLIRERVRKRREAEGVSILGDDDQAGATAADADGGKRASYGATARAGSSMSVDIPAAPMRDVASGDDGDDGDDNDAGGMRGSHKAVSGSLLIKQEQKAAFLPSPARASQPGHDKYQAL